MISPLHNVIFSLEGKNQGQRELPGYLITRTLAVTCRQSGQQLLGGQNSVREARPVDLVRRVHAFRLKGSGRILNQGDVVAKLHAKASGALDAGVGYHADEDDLLDPMLCELGVEVGIGEAALCPVLKHDDVASAGTELGMELSAPRSGGEAVD